jgi:hypothetical protein
MVRVAGNAESLEWEVPVLKAPFRIGPMGRAGIGPSASDAG